MSALFVDSSVLLYAVGGTHRHQQSCRRILQAAQAKTVVLHGSVECVQEALFHRLRMTDRTSALADASDFRELLTLHDFDRTVLTRMLGLVEHTHLRGRDVVHAATALEHGFTEIVAADRDFDGIPGLARVDPEGVLEF